MTAGNDTSIEEWLLETCQRATPLPESSVDGFLFDLHDLLRREGLEIEHVEREGAGALTVTVAASAGRVGGMLRLRRALSVASYDFSCVWTGGGEEDHLSWARLLTGLYDEHDDCNYLLRLMAYLRPAEPKERTEVG